jgi:hypothetical protein
MPEPEMSNTIDASAVASEFAPVPSADFISLLRRTGFSAEAYRDAYGDLAAMNLDATKALAHFLHAGLDERRRAPLTLDRKALIALARLPLHDADFKAKLLTSLGSHLFDNVEHPYGLAIAERWPDICALAREAARPYFIAGDNHSNQYALTGTRDGAWLLPIHMLCTGGSAGGLGNPRSRSGYGNLLRQAVRLIETLPGADELPFLLQFGQVDIEFVYHYRRVRDGKRALDLDDYRAFCDTVLDRYIAYVTGLFASARRLRVFLVSVFPPTLPDAAWQQGYVDADIAERETAIPVAELSAGIRELEIADLRQRTEVHAYYNDRLRTACRRHGLRFVDSFTPFLGADGLTDASFVVAEADGAEHYLDSRATYGAVAGLIWTCIDAIGPAKILTGGPVQQSPR